MTTEQLPVAPRLTCQLDYLCSVSINVAFAIIGPLPEGIRLNASVTGGEVSGPRVRGTLRPVGGDWFTLRTDGIGLVDARITLETDDGALIDMWYTGVYDVGEDGYQRFVNGEPAPDGARLRTAPRFQTTHPGYTWLNRLQCVAIGEMLPKQDGVRYDVYAMR